MTDLAFLIPLFPLAGFLLLFFLGRRFGEPVAGWIATFFCSFSFLATVLVFFGLLSEPSSERFHVQKLFTWISVGSFEVDFGLLVDPLSITMCLFITGVGSLIHMYSIGYMHGDPNFSKFFVYLNLFVASMIFLVLSDNLLLTFLGWEGVGACSYLLISFWFTDEANATAGKKAFVTNRIGDLGFMLGTFLLFISLGSINYDDILTRSGELTPKVASIVVVLFLLGAAGKSAQLPLYVWLPDAMAGPTPVSALIHAATMVTSGVFLLTRLNPVLAMAETWTGAVIAWVGALTALFAATVAVAQTDIKKVLAYSTVSQLGYMFLAIGVGGYVPAIFHMITHAFFKALLFLGSGSVIHGLDGEQDMRRMGGLQKFMPVTGFTFIVGWLAIAGVPPFSGFWSKDEILLYAWDAEGVGGKGLWVVGIVTALLTAFYMTRQVILTFFGETRFFQPSEQEIEQAWANRVESVRSEALELSEAQTKLETTAEKAIADLAKRRAAVEKSADDLIAAQAAIDAASEADDGYEKLTKALDKATKAGPKADTALGKAQEKADMARDAQQEGEKELIAVQAQILEVENLANRVESSNGPVTALSEGPDISEIEDYLPESYTNRLDSHPHESPSTMTVPLIVLASLAAVAGLLNLPFAKSTHFLKHWLEPSLFGNEHKISAGAATKWGLAFFAIACAAVAIFAAFSVYRHNRQDPSKIELEGMARAWWVDQTYADFFGGPGRALFNFFSSFDRGVVDGAVNGLSKGVSSLGRSMKVLQPGLVRSYALGIAAGSILIMFWFIGRIY